MNLLSKWKSNFLVGGLLGACALPLAWAQQPDPAALLQEIRQSSTSENMDLVGKIRKESLKEIEVRLFIRKNNIQFRLQEELFHLRLGEGRADLLTVTKEGSSMPFPGEKLRESIRGTDVTYEDFTLLFLYWPKPVLQGEEKVAGEDCFRLQLANPDDTGAYGSVTVWVHKRFRAFWKMRGFDRKGKALKEFQVQSVMQNPNGKGYALQSMRVNLLNDEGRVAAITYLTFENQLPTGLVRPPK